MHKTNLQHARYRRNIVRYVLTTLVVSMSLWATQARAALDMFLVIDGIEGESTDRQFPGAIEVLAWSWGLANSASAQGTRVGKTTVQDLSFTQYFDKSTPQLIMSNFTGTLIPKATLVVRKAGERPLIYLTIAMEDVLVTSDSTGGSGGENLLVNNVTLNFRRVCVTYTGQNETGGQGDSHEACWNVATNKAY